MKPRAIVAGIAAIAVLGLLAACSGDYDRYATDTTSSTTAPPTTQAQPPASPPPTAPPSTPPSTPPPTTAAPGATTTTVAPPPGVAPGRLAVVTASGDLVTVRPDGAEVRTVTDAPPGGTVVQATWSPDSSRIAYSTTTRRDATIGVATLDGAAPVTQPLPTAPFHLTWAPSQATLATLRVDSVDSVELATRDSTLQTEPQRVASGSTLSVAWSPDGRRLVAMVDDDQLVLVDAAGATSPLAVDVAPSGAPSWIDDDTIVTAVQTSTDRRLVLLDVDTGARQDLLTYEGVVTFLPDPAGSRIAYQLTPQQDRGGGGGRVSFPHERSRAQRSDGTPPEALDGVLAVHDLATGSDTQVLDNVADAFQWSPDSTRLAVLDPGDDGTSRWRFWAPGTDLIDGAAFAPSQTSTQLVLPYFDLLATSTRWWAPDGSAFAFAGRVQGREGVWVQPVEAATAPTYAHDGDLVTWSWS